MTSRFRSGFWLVGLGLSIVLRGGVLVAVPDAMTTDPDAYWQLGRNLAKTGTLGFTRAASDETSSARIQPTAYRPPLYTLLIAFCAWFGPSARLILTLIHFAAGVATCLLVSEVARRFATERIALLATVLVAADPLLLGHSTLVMTETLAALLVAAVLFVTAGRGPEELTLGRSAWVGILLGLLALCRPAFLLFGAVYCGWLVLLAGSPRGRIGRALACTLSASLIVSPWIVRNWVHWETWIPGTTHGGFTLYLANNPSFYAYLKEGESGELWRPDEIQPERQRSSSRSALDRAWVQQRDRLMQLAEHDEVLAEREAYRLAWETIHDQPTDFAYASMIRVGRFWQLTPHRTVAGESTLHAWLRYTVGIGYAALFTFCVVGLFSLGRCCSSPPWIVILLLAACLTLIHAFFWTNMRMRAPLQPALALLAAYGWSRIFPRFCCQSDATLP